MLRHVTHLPGDRAHHPHSPLQECQEQHPGTSLAVGRYRCYFIRFHFICSQMLLLFNLVVRCWCYFICTLLSDVGVISPVVAYWILQLLLLLLLVGYFIVVVLFHLIWMLFNLRNQCYFTCNVTLVLFHLYSHTGVISHIVSYWCYFTCRVVLVLFHL